MRSWVFGSRADCDVVVDSPLASGRHCQLTHRPGGLILEDLGSASGTYVDGKRIDGPTRLSPNQEITIGPTMPMPWPPDLVKFFRIGRVEGNDIVLDDLRVSSRHARLMIVAGTDALIEDLGSSNGTFLNSADARVTRLTPLSARDIVYFGSLAVPAAKLLAGLLGEAPLPQPAIPAQQRPPSLAPRTEAPPPVPAPSAKSFIEQNLWLLAALCQAPVLAFVIVLASGRQAAAAVTDANWASIAGAITATTFALALAAVWLGCSLAVAEAAGGPWPKYRNDADLSSFLIAVGSRLAMLVSACAFGCALLLAIVYWGSGLEGPWFPLWGIFMLASTVGLLLGLLIGTVLTPWQRLAPALLGCLALMTVLGGWFWPLAGKSLPVHVASGAMPSRWAFEAALLLESPHHPSPAKAGDQVPAPARDLAEDLFPADTDRMGTAADAMALASMLIGLAGALVLQNSRPG
jgi:pSer/pThr/pTyr-binding forkhead associated (FHA) protein